jgi:hypothetical protein
LLAQVPKFPTTKVIFVAAFSPTLVEVSNLDEQEALLQMDAKSVHCLTTRLLSRNRGRNNARAGRP